MNPREAMSPNASLCSSGSMAPSSELISLLIVVSRKMYVKIAVKMKVNKIMIKKVAVFVANGLANESFTNELSRERRIFGSKKIIF